MNDIENKINKETPALLSRSLAAGFIKYGKMFSTLLRFSAADEVMIPARIVCLSLEAGRVSILYGTRMLKKIKLVAAKSFVVEAGRYADPEFAASCLSLAREEFGAAGSTVVLNIPKEWTILQSALLPITVKENLDTALNYELDRLTPFNPEDAYWDFKILREEENDIEVLIAAAKAESLNPYLRAIRETGIPVAGVTFHLSGIVALLNYAGHSQDALFVAINKDSYEGILIKGGVLSEVFADLFSAPDETARTQQTLNEILPFRGHFLEQNKSPLVIIDQGNDACTITAQKIPFQVKEMKDLLKTAPLNKSDTGAIVQDQWKAAGGALEYLWPKAVRFNLLAKGQRKKEKTPRGLTILLSLLILAMGILYFLAPLELERRKQEVMDEQIKAMKDDVKKVELLKKEVETLGTEIVKIHSFKENRFMSLSVLQEMTSLLPKTVWLTRVRMTDKGVDIEGYANRASEILSKIENSPFFAKVEFSSPTVRDTRMNADRFIIKMELEPGNLKKGLANK